MALFQKVKKPRSSKASLKTVEMCIILYSWMDEGAEAARAPRGRRADAFWDFREG